MEYPAGLAPPEHVPGLHEALVLGVLSQSADLVGLALVEVLGADAGRPGGAARDDHVGPVATALEQDVVTDLQKQREVKSKCPPGPRQSSTR